MPLNITNRDDYILVESITGMDFWDIMDGIPKLFSMPEFKEKNDIWLFRGNQIKMSIIDLDTIKDSVEKFCPKGFKGKKTAIVTESGFQHSLAIMYSEIGKDLSREIRVFSDLNSARDWIIT